MGDDPTQTGVSARSARLRGFFARYVAARGGAQDPRIEQAFAAVPREPFAGPAPWFIFAASPWGTPLRSAGYLETPDGDAAFLYQDVLVALDRKQGINIGEPSLHARCLDALSPQPGETVLQVGAGSGYYTAVLAQLVGPAGQVHAFEIDPALADRARHNLAPWPWAAVEARSGIAAGLPKADAIYVNAGITQPSREWLEALRPDGRLIFPLQPEGGYGGMLLLQRPPDHGPAWPARFVSRAAFIACQGRQVAQTGRGLAAAFADGGWDEVQSLRLDGRPDDTSWFAGEGWWLSTRAAPK